jgi:hypothetical protein
MFFLSVSAVIVFSLSTKTPQRVVHTPASSPRSIMLGMWTQGFFDAQTKTLHPKKLEELETQIDKKVSIAHYYRGWESLSDPTLLQEFSVIRTHGWTPMLNVNPYFFSKCPPTALPLYQAIAHGDCDSFLKKAAANLAHNSQPVYLLFAWEMTNKELPWSIKYSGSTAEDFVMAWRHMHTIFTAGKVKNVLWVFCPNITDSTSIAYKDIYPGDAFVDWVGLDGYNYGTTQSWSQWSSFRGTFTSSYHELTTVAPNKPLMIAEVNTTDKGGDKAQWYKDMLLEELPDTFPHIKAVVFFNEDKTATEGVNWKIDVSNSSLQGFTEGIRSPLYK